MSATFGHHEGGPTATAGGLVFIGAAMDDYLRACDSETGEELWRGRLPGLGTGHSSAGAGRLHVVCYVRFAIRIREAEAGGCEN